MNTSPSITAVGWMRTPGQMTITAQVRTRGEHLTVCDADIEQDGRELVHAVATFALLHD